MGRGGSCCSDENEEDEVDYDPAHKGIINIYFH